MKRINIFLTALLVLVLIFSSCTTNSSPNSGSYDVTIKPSEGQPAFPKLGKYWVVDNAGCFSEESMKLADEVFEKLRLDGIAEVAVICQKGIVNRGPMNDDKIWARDWGRFAKLGDKEDRRAVVWLIRPDVKPEENRVTVEISTWLYQLTAIDYGDALREAANFANWNDFDGCLDSISRNTDEKLREIWKTHQK